MTDQRRPHGEETAPGDLPIETIVDLQGDEMPAEQDAFIDPDEIEALRPRSLTELDRGIVEDPSMRIGETTSPVVATEEGQTWVPPTGPRIVPDDARDRLDEPASADPDAGLR